MAAGDAAPEGAIREGSAEILPVARQGGAATAEEASGQHGGDGRAGGGKPAADQSVFYNPAQVFNRDLSVLVLNVFSALRSSEEEEKKRIWEEKDAKRREMPNYKPPSNNFSCPDYKGLAILEGLAASGLRSVRYWKEVTGVDRIVVNDLDVTAVCHMKKNIEHNEVPSDRVRPNQGDVNLHLYNNAKAYDVVDLDPYGTASPFLDAAMVGVKSGGLLCVTSTDMPILGGNHPEVCFYRYGGTALKARYVHEMSLRLLMNAIAAAAARHQRSAEPLLSCSIDFYVRVFVRVYDMPVRAKELASKTGLVYQCCQCEAFHVQPLGLLEFGGKKAKRGEREQPAAAATPEKPPETEEAGSSAASTAAPKAAAPALPSKYKVPKALEHIGSSCGECGGRYSIGGPFYLGSLYSKDFVDACLSVCDRESLEHVTSWRKITGLLTAMSEEIEDVPLHYSLPSLCGTLRLDCAPARQFRGALQHLGYRVSHFHREPSAIKTDAPNSVVFDVLRKWAEHQGKTVGGAASSAPAAPTDGAGSGNQASTVEATATGQGGADAAEGGAAAEGKSRKALKKQKVADPTAAKILEKAISTAGLRELDFDSMNVKDEERPRKVPRFLPNPEKFWGPKPRAKPQRAGAEGPDAGAAEAGAPEAGAVEEKSCATETSGVES